jgi:peptide-N4-(N-acetyl-beta-glucosaminyl)asparagine amidase
MSSSIAPTYRDLVFLETFIRPHLSHVTRASRDVNAHKDAKELVPLSEILQDNLEILDDEDNYKDNLLPLVVNWFKTKFFKWFEAPACEKCSEKLKLVRAYQNAEKKNVELYACDKDKFEYQFIRHNEPAILLHTRTGRCGEWAMCFYIILRALDYHTRIVYDSTDHVWNEVWSDSKNEFIHVDPCENTVNSPLLYEMGWGKKLEYCIAMGQYEVSDVTGRYVKDFKATLNRRDQCNETWLSQHLAQMTLELLALAPSETRSIIAKRRAQDLKNIDDLAKCDRQTSDGQLPCRKTGSAEWRKSRGE